MSRLSATQRALLTAMAAFCLLGAGQCSAMLGVKRDDAVEAVPNAFGDVTAYQGCDNYPLFKDTVAPILQQQCVSCHGPGGKGSENMLLQQGTDDLTIATNYAETLTKFASDFGNGDVEANLLLAKINGRITHDLKMDVTGPDYVNIVTWASYETQDDGSDFCSPADGTGTEFGGAAANGGS